MKIAAIITSALITLSAVSSMASDCIIGINSGRSKNTNPPAKSMSVVSATTNSQNGAK